jgi:hypothetical protein
MFPINGKLTKLDIAFPASVQRMMPAYDAIPEDYKRGSKPACRIASRWFFEGLPKATEFKPRTGVDVTQALAQLKCILGSFEPKHEHKKAAVAFLLDEWFEEVRIP